MVRHIKKSILFFYLVSQAVTGMAQSQIDIVQWSQDFLYAVRVEEKYDSFERKLATISPRQLQEWLDSEAKKMAFWLNVYNAYIQIKEKESPTLIQEKRNSFFTKKWITIAHKDLSFDKIEHGIIRRSKWKYGMGYFQKWFPGKFEKMVRLEQVDYRIHFALNCGASSCPPIAFYSAEYIDEELTLATESFLSNDVTYSEEENTVSISKIFKWFKGDFGGEKGIVILLQEKGLIPSDKTPKIRYKPYDWTLSLENYVEK